MNSQNTHILTKLKDVQRATTDLINAGLTVTHIEVEGARPRINLLSAPRYEQRLPVSWTVIRQSARGKEVEMAACINGCEIHWTEQA